MATGAVGATSPGAASQVNNISLQDFLKILSTQLTNQDPLKPLDDQQFLAQIAQFSTLEQSTQLNASIGQMLTLQSVTQSVGLIGKTVTLSPGSGGGTPTSGQVTALDYVSGQVQLTVTSSTGAVQNGIPLTQVMAVR